MKLNPQALPMDRLLAMKRAGDDLMRAGRALARADTTPLERIVGAPTPPAELQHYPEGDVYDKESHAQYYFHAHRHALGEAGHIHTFLRAPAIAAECSPPRDVQIETRPLGENAVCHIIAVSLDRRGRARTLFTTNRWVTDETFYWADDAVRCLDGFVVDHAYPCWATNRWLTALLVLFRPQIEQLLRTRDAALLARRAQHPDVDVFEDTSFEVISEMDIDVETQIAEVDELLQRRERMGASVV